MELPFDPAVPHWYYTLRILNHQFKSAYTRPIVHSCSIYNGQVLETASVPISKGVDQKTVVHLHNGIVGSRKKEGAPTLRDSMMELESIMLSEIRQAAKDKYHMISPISGN